MTSAEIRWNHESLVLNWAGVFLLPWLLIDKNPFCSQVRSEELGVRSGGIGMILLVSIRKDTKGSHVSRMSQ